MGAFEAMASVSVELWVSTERCGKSDIPGTTFQRRSTYSRSLCIRILILTVLLPLQPPFTPLSSTSSSITFRAARTMSDTSSGSSISAAPNNSAHAHDCGHPQLRSTPEQYGNNVDVVLANSRGLLAPSCTIVGTDVADEGKAKSCGG